jgi:putative Holliday junction resolvase
MLSRQYQPNGVPAGAVGVRPFEKAAFMTDTDPLAFVASLPAGARLFGLDLGTRTIGLAVSDQGHRIASPLETIGRVKFSKDVAKLLDLAARNNVGGLVMGLPINMDGSEGPRAQSTRAFCRNLKPLTALPLIFWDERMSTAAVTRTLLEADTSRRRRDEVVDKMAAAFILQGFLDRLHLAERSDDLRRL